jgi:hypothetical protein
MRVLGPTEKPMRIPLQMVLSLERSEFPSKRSDGWRSTEGRVEHFVVGDAVCTACSTAAEKRGIPEDFLAFDKLFIIIPGMVVEGCGCRWMVSSVLL